MKTIKTRLQAAENRDLNLLLDALPRTDIPYINYEGTLKTQVPIGKMCPTNPSEIKPLDFDDGDCPRHALGILPAISMLLLF